MAHTKKRPYQGSKAIDKSCRSHGSCRRCQGARKHKKVKQCPPTEKVEEG